MAGQTPTTIAFERILNFRDLASCTTTEQSPRNIKITSNKIFRSARPDAATPADRHLLTSIYAIKTIIDLRTPTEHLEARRKYTSSPPMPSNPTVTPPDPKSLLRIPGIDYKDINFNGPSYSNALIKQLPWHQTAKLFALYALGYRTQAISILGGNVMAKRGLAGLAEDSLQHCTKEIREAFATLAAPEAYPVLVHCTQGKDRTGLVVLLVLMLLGVERDRIEDDYRLSERELGPEREEKVREIMSIRLPEEFADCPGGWVDAVCGWIERRFGGVERYLEHCGVTGEMRGRVKDVLLEEG